MNECFKYLTISLSPPPPGVPPISNEYALISGQLNITEPERKILQII